MKKQTSWSLLKTKKKHVYDKQQPIRTTELLYPDLRQTQKECYTNLLSINPFKLGYVYDVSPAWTCWNQKTNKKSDKFSQTTGNDVCIKGQNYMSSTPNSGLYLKF